MLLFLAVALMESLGIKVLVSAESQHAGLQGFVSPAQHRAIIANWVRSEGIWLVDSTEHVRDGNEWGMLCQVPRSSPCPFSKTIVGEPVP